MWKTEKDEHVASEMDNLVIPIEMAILEGTKTKLKKDLFRSDGHLTFVVRSWMASPVRQGMQLKQMAWRMSRR